MRIISGNLKGKSINFVKNSKTRPLKDSVRENIFNILAHSNSFNISFEEASVIDLYSGVGSFGIECLSRGAQKVTFVEYDSIATKILKNNLAKLSILEKAYVHNGTVEQILEQSLTERFDIFFFDPPFLDKNFSRNLDFIKKKKIYKKEHIVIIHREKKSDDDLISKIQIIKTKVYGRSKIIFGVFS